MKMLKLLTLMWFVSCFGAVLAEEPAEITDYSIVGEGAVKVLIIPCMSCRWRAFDGFMQRNKDKYTMYAVTIPGYGGSKIPDLPMYGTQPVWQNHAIKALEHFIEQYQIKDAVVLTHSWGAMIATSLLAKDASFAQSWVILDNYIPMDEAEQNLPYEEKVKLVDRWRIESMEPYRAPDQWAKFNKASSRIPADRQLLYHGMFMATPPDVVFQYWRENGLMDVNKNFAKINIPVLEIKSISERQTDHAAAMKRYLSRYDTIAHPAQLKTVFIHNTGHHQIEERPYEIDQLLDDYIQGKKVADVYPQEK